MPEMDERIPVDQKTAQAWVAVAHGARLASHILRAVGDPAPGSNFARTNSLYPPEKASDWHRAFLTASLEHLLLWGDLAAPLTFHPEHEVTYAFRPAHTLGRAALEAAAQAVWMSAGGSAAECSRRHLSLVRWDYEEHRKSVQDPAAKAQIAQMDAALLERCAERHTDKDLAPPSHYSVLRWAAPEVAIEPDEIERIWRAASGAAHGKRWSALVLQHLIQGPEYEPGQHRTLAIPDTAGMTEILRAAEQMTFYGVLRHADFCGADIQALIDSARLWLVSVVPFQEDADPAILAHLLRPPLTTGTPTVTDKDE